MRTGGRPRELAGSEEWLSFAASLPAKPIPFTNLSANYQIYQGRCILTGYVLDNKAGSSFLFQLCDGQDSNGPTLTFQFPSAGQLTIQPMPGRGILCENGVFAVLTGGPMSGSVFVIPLFKYPHTPPGE